MNLTKEDRAAFEWLHTWTWMSEWERHCHRLGTDPDDEDAKADFEEAMHEESLFGKDY